MRSFVLSRARAANYPGILQDIVLLVGEETTAKLIAQHGGGAGLYIPVKINPDHYLYQLLGEEAARFLVAEFGGLTLEIPRAAVLQRMERNKKILADHEASMSHNDLAIKYQLTTRCIRNIVPKVSKNKQARKG